MVPDAVAAGKILSAAMFQAKFEKLRESRKAYDEFLFVSFTSTKLSSY